MLLKEIALTEGLQPLEKLFLQVDRIRRAVDQIIDVQLDKNGKGSLVGSVIEGVNSGISLKYKHYNQDGRDMIDVQVILAQPPILPETDEHKYMELDDTLVNGIKMKKTTQGGHIVYTRTFKAPTNVHATSSEKRFSTRYA